MEKTLVFLKKIYLFLKDTLIFLIQVPLFILGVIIFVFPGAIITIVTFSIFFSDTLNFRDLISSEKLHLSTLENLILNVSLWGFSYLFYKYIPLWKEKVIDKIFISENERA